MNQIRRRLAEIDKQLSRSPAYYLTKTISMAPLAFCAVGTITGIVIQNKVQWNIHVWLAALAICSLILATLLLVLKVNRVYSAAFLALFCFVCLGAIRLTSFNSPGPNDIRNSVGYELAPATIRGLIVTEPYRDSNDWVFSKFTHKDPGSSFYLKVTEAETINGWTKANGLVRVRVNEPVPGIKTGDYVQIYCLLNRFAAASNPGEFDVAEYLARKGVFVGASVKSRDAIEPLQTNMPGSFTRIRSFLRNVAISSLIGGGEMEDEQEKLLLALVLGFRADIDHETIEAFRKTGLLHFICLSGMNFGIVIWFIWWACKTMGLMKPARSVVCILSAILFLLVVPENAPAFRAAVMCFAFCGAFIFRRNSNPFNSLALSAIVLLLIRPTGLFEADWQLSFASVLGILLLAKPIEFFLREKVPGPLRDGLRHWLAAAFSVSLSAWLASAGILLYHFYAIQLLTSFWTVLISPLIGLVSILGYLKLVVGLFLPSISAAMGMVINVLAGWLIWIVKALAALDISEILIGKTGVTAIILYYALVIYAGFFNFKYRLIKKTALTAGTLSLAVILLLPAWQRSNHGSLTAIILDVGHGQAVLAQLPGGNNILFDAGSMSRDNIGARVVTPFLQYAGLKKIDAIVVSHGDIDHINGIPEVVRDNRTQAVLVSDAFLNGIRPTVKFLKNELQQQGIETKPTGQKIQSSSSAAMTVLWPVKDIVEDNQVSDNDKSIVALIGYAGRRILISSDVEKFAQAEILRLYPDLKADVLIAPHHGSKKTLERKFLEVLQPTVVICSCTRAAFEKGRVIKDPNSYYTGRDGAVIVRINQAGVIETDTFRIKK